MDMKGMGAPRKGRASGGVAIAEPGNDGHKHHKSDPDMMSLWANTPDQHAFVMCGTEALFLVHLTMFHMEEHCYQLVLRARLTDQVMKTYVEDRKKHPNECYFIGNAPTDGMMVPDFQSGRRTAFVADIFRGLPLKYHYRSWPWAHQEPVLHNILVQVERVVYYRHFDFNLEYPPTLTYVLFGEGNEAFLDHYQTKQPDFDQVVALSEAPHWLPKRLLEAGLHVNIPGMSSYPIPCSNPLKPGELVVQYGEQRRERIKVGRSYWFSTKVVNAEGEDPCHSERHKGP
jgi:hypothetical protein